MFIQNVYSKKKPYFVNRTKLENYLQKLNTYNSVNSRNSVTKFTTTTCVHKH